MILQGNALDVLRTGPDESIQCCVTSPPYWGLRDYGVEEQIGLEKTPEEYVTKLVDVFREVRRVLRPDGTLWLNLGDSYATGAGAMNTTDPKAAGRLREASGITQPNRRPIPGLKPKDLVGIPWMVAFALRSDGWYLRSDIIWAKNNPMPESVRDRPTKAHEYLFLLSKSPNGGNGHEGGYSHAGQGSSTRKFGADPTTRNARSVWTINTKPYREAHFATFPEELPRRCILAGSKPGDTALDPFGGAGTTELVATKLGRACVSIELNPAYVEIATRRNT
jgi:DNA modification methylase